MNTRNFAAASLAVFALAACGDDTSGTDTDTGTDAGADLGGDTTGTDTTGTDTVETDTTGTDTTGTDTVETDTTGTDTTGRDTTTAPPTLQEVYDAVFAPTCSGRGCHNNDANGIDMSTVTGLRERLLADSPTAGFPFVTPGSLDESYLWHKIKNTQGDVGGFGTRMPLQGLSASDIALVEDWIAGGALE